jgi:hypothetical protein
MSDVKQFTYDDLNEHKSRDSLWLTIHKKVYDVTAFLDEVSCLLWFAAGWWRAGAGRGDVKMSGAESGVRHGGRGSEEDSEEGGGGGHR